MVDPTLPEALAKNWFFVRSGEKCGPLQMDELADLVRSWEIGRETLVWHPSMPSWEPAGEVAALDQVLQDQSPPPLPSENLDEPPVPPPLPAQEESYAPSSAANDALALDRSDAGREHAQLSEGAGNERGLAWPSARRARAGLIMMLLLSAVSIIATYGQIRLLNQAAAGLEISPSRAEASDRGVALVSLIWFVAYVLTAVLFIGWLRQAYDSAKQIEPEALRYTKKWTIWGWIIPIGFLYIPYRIVKDVWSVFSPDADELGWPNLLGWWWLMWIMTNGLAWFSLRGSSAETISGLRTMSWLSLFSDLAALAAAAFAIKIVIDLTRAAEYARAGHAV